MASDTLNGTIPEIRKRPPGRPLNLDGLGRRKKRKLRNGDNTLLSAVDGRCLYAKRFKEICTQLIEDQGGEGELSEARLQLIRRFATTCVLAEQMEVRMALGETINLDDHATICSTLVKIAQRIGLDRIPRNITPTLRDYLDQHAPIDAVDAEVD